jgi:hypothetical protein
MNSLAQRVNGAAGSRQKADAETGPTSLDFWYQA